MTTRAYGFQSRGDLQRVAGAALKNEHLNLHPAGRDERPGVQPVKVYLKISGPRIEDEDRNCYPCEVYLRDGFAPSPSESEDRSWVGLETDAGQVGNKGIAVTPNGEVLRQNVVYEGLPFDVWEVQDPDTLSIIGTLSARSNDTEGTVTLTGVTELIEDDDEVIFTWADGSRSSVVLAVFGDQFTFSGGSGDPLPDTDTVVYILVVKSIERSAIMVDCTDAVEFVRTTSFRNDDGDYRGYVQEWNTVTRNWTDGEEVWVRNAN